MFMKNKIINIVTKVITSILGIVTFLLMIYAAYNFFSIKILKKDYTSVFGYTFFEVISGSMSPTIEKWDLILIKQKDNYEVGDVVSFYNDGAYITHRIVEKNNETYITKGDANNTVDSPITKDKIAGKVVKVFGGFAAWIKVFTTPKVAIMCLMSIILLCYTFSLFKKEGESKIKEAMKIEKSEAMEKIKNNTRLKLELCIFFILLISLVFLIPYTLSRFKSEARGDAGIDVAFFIAKDEYQRDEITLTDMKPGDEYSYTFTVSNFQGSDRAEVNLSYNIEVTTTTNLPMVYELYITNSGTDSPIVSTDQIITDDDDTYFKKMITSSRNFDFRSNYTDSYKLTVKFPAEYKTFRYQGVAENVEIKVIAKQLLDSDN